MKYSYDDFEKYFNCGSLKYCQLIGCQLLEQIASNHQCNKQIIKQVNKLKKKLLKIESIDKHTYKSLLFIKNYIYSYQTY